MTKKKPQTNSLACLGGDCDREKVAVFRQWQHESPVVQNRFVSDIRRTFVVFHPIWRVLHVPVPVHVIVHVVLSCGVPPIAPRKRRELPDSFASAKLTDSERRRSNATDCAGGDPLPPVVLSVWPIGLDLKLHSLEGKQLTNWTGRL